MTPTASQTARRTRIVATLGPATDRTGVLEGLIRAGLDVARLNFSHGADEGPRRRAAEARRLAGERAAPLAVLADLPGPKLRAQLTAPLMLLPGQEIAPDDLHPTEPEALAAVRPGHRVLLDDGRLQLRAVTNDHGQLVLRVEAGGALLPNKGLNLPDSELPIPALTPRDHAALAAAAEIGADWLALSFVRGPEAAEEVRAAARKLGLDAPVLAKIERPEAVARAPEIVAAFDGIMVARGDLGVELPLERVPQVQKRLIKLARAAGKPVITATDMLDSMRSSPRPTRAEASDVANAVYDGTDAVMLSGETAVGEYPVESVACMDRIVREAEAHLPVDLGAGEMPGGSVTDQLTHLAVGLAREANAGAIVVPTLSGRTARLVARHRPTVPVVAPTPEAAVLRRLALVWGVVPVPMPHLPRGEDRLQAAVRAAAERGAVMPGQRVIVLADHAVEGADLLPTLRVVRVGEKGESLAP